MRKWPLAAVSALVVALAGIWTLSPADAQTEGGFHIEGTRLVDANGEPFVMRGSSHPDVWYEGEFDSYGELSDLGANTVRVVLGSGRQWGPSSASRVADIIEECKANQVVCVLEVHDTTGYGEEDAAATLDQAVDYWQSIQSVLEGQEAYVLINIGNEPWGNQNTSGWIEATKSAIQEMRSSGFEHTLVVDAPNWGQDWEHVMLDNAPEVAAADEDGNTLFSVHMYEVYTDAQTVVDYFDAFEAMGLPLIVGEYGFQHGGQPVAWETVQNEAQARGIGWIAWSYSGNGSGVEFLDQVTDFDPSRLTDWGEQVFHSENGIVNTAERASVFGDEPDDPTASDDPTTEPPEGDCTAEIEIVSEWGSGWQATVAVSADQEALSGWTLSWTWPGDQTVQSHWNVELDSSGASVTAGDVGWNGAIAAGQTREVFGFVGTGAAVTPQVTCTGS
jgi:mannan endo-1,4-beta-mannosidase